MYNFPGFHGLFAGINPHLVSALDQKGNGFSFLTLPREFHDTEHTNLMFLRESTISLIKRTSPDEKLIPVAHSLGAPRLFQVINSLKQNPFYALVLICPVPPGDIGTNLRSWREVKARIKTFGAYWPIIRQCGIFPSGWDRMVVRDYETFCQYLLPPGMEEKEKREAFGFQGPEPGRVVRAAILKRPTIDWGKINCPVIIFLGGEDRILSPDLRIGEKMITALRNAHPKSRAPHFFTCETISGMGHYLRKVDAVEIVDTTLSYLSLLEHFGET